MKKINNRVLVGLLALIIIIGSSTSCTEVKAYQKAHLNDDDMAIGGGKLDGFDESWESYREGASGGTGGKSGGGCGCN